MSPLAKTIGGLLELVGGPIEVSAPERFLVRENFVASCEGELPLSYLGEDFASKFSEIVEQDVGPARLQQYRLLRATIDGPILTALGGEAKARIALAHLFAFLKTADRERWYFFYVADALGTLWAVDTYWRDGGWDIEAYSATYPRGWRGGGHLVSPGDAWRDA